MGETLFKGKAKIANLPKVAAIGRKTELRPRGHGVPFCVALPLREGRCAVAPVLVEGA
jgi:hypothetical protein